MYSANRQAATILCFVFCFVVVAKRNQSENKEADLGVGDSDGWVGWGSRGATRASRQGHGGSSQSVEAACMQVQ